MKKLKILCSLGGGFTSSAEMPRILLAKYPKEQIEFVNCVLPNEHPDTWQLFDAVENTLNIKITYIAYHPETKWQLVQKEDRANRDLLHTPFDIFKIKGFIGNSRNDPCSRVLKRETIYNYVSEKYSPNEIVIAVGIHADEFERAAAIRENWEKKGYKTIFPVIKELYKSKEEQISLLNEWYGVTLDLYEKGFEHNNCGGACVKAGQRQWAMLWYYYPHIYQEWETAELEWGDRWNDTRGKQYTILKMRRNGKIIYITLKDFREQILEPAFLEENDTMLGKFIKELPGNPGCMWCSAI